MTFKKKVIDTLSIIVDKINMIEEKIENIESRVGSMEVRLENIEVRLTNVEKRVANNETKIDSMQNQIERLDIKIDEVENRLREEMKLMEYGLKKETLMVYQMVMENKKNIEQLLIPFTDRNFYVSDEVAKISKIENDLNMTMKVVGEHSTAIRRLQGNPA